MSLIEIDHLSHVYKGGIKALDDLSFSVEEGEILGLLGPNGAGKSTCVKMITGAIRPSCGSVRVSGYEVFRNLRKVRHIIGVMPQETALYQDLTAQETLEYHADIYGVPREVRDDRIAEMLKLAGLSLRKDDLVKTYSGGMKRRLALVRALLHDSKLLILDEMSLGIDVQSRNLIWQQVKMLKKEGKTIIFCTNYMDEADELADRLVIIDRGRLVAEGSPQSLKKTHVGNFIIELEFRGLTDEQDQSWISEQIGLEVELASENEDPGIQTARIQSEDGYNDLPQVIRILSNLGITVRQASMRSPSLGDVFLTITGSKLRD